MRVTLMGVLGFLAIAALLVFAGYEWHRLKMEQSQAKPYPPQVNRVNP